MTARPEAPQPLSRRGPRPLLLHLTLAWMKSTGSIGASMNWNAVWQNLSHPTPETVEPAALAAAFARAAEADRALIAGIAAYRRAGYVRQMRDPPAVWEEGESRILDYGGQGTPVLFVPSLINRAYILDLMPGGSMLRWLAEHGAHPYLLDWGWPTEPERKFSLTDYIAGRLERAIAALPGPIVLAGYCMGGLLTLAAAQRQPAKIRALALFATPWDFHAADPAAAKRLADSLPLLEPMLNLSGALPIDALQTLFTAIDPHGVGDKYRSFSSLDQTSPRARRFVAMEDWLADGVPLAAPVARETIGGWYGGNSTAAGTWRVAGLAVDPAALTMPAFCAIPARDRLVPPESARALAARLANPIIVEPRAGHIGMIAGTNAEPELWQPFAEWLQGLC
jgi:poly(3-hydroxyalkanoate) synthetase